MAIRNWLREIDRVRRPCGAFYSGGTLGCGPCTRRFARQRLCCHGQPLDRALVWFRRDLRADDHAALYHALRAARQVWCAFVFDRDILDPLPRADRRVEFIHDSLVGLDAQLRALGARTASQARG